MDHDRYDDSYIKGILDRVRTVAMVGASANVNRPSYFVLKYLLAKGYRVVAVNPTLAGAPILNAPSVATLAEARGALGGAPIDMVDVFRNSEAALAITREAIALKSALGLNVVWMQLTVRNDGAAAEAEAQGLNVVMNRCPKIEYGRLSGEIGWQGVNPGVISSRRPILGAGVQNQTLGVRRAPLTNVKTGETQT